MLTQSRLIWLVAALLLVATACDGGDSGSDTETVSGFIFIDSTGSHVCGSMLESHPPQCGEPSTGLLDLDTESVVALLSPDDPATAPVFWTDYAAEVEGEPRENGLSNVILTDPVYSNGSDELVLRTVDLGLFVGEPAVWPFDLTNGTDADIILTFTSGQRMELTLDDDSGEVYRWSEDMMFTQAVEEVVLPSGSTLPLVLTAEPIDLPPGDYSAKAWVRAAEAMDLFLTWNVTISG